MELADRFDVPSTPDQVWALFWDLPRVAMCLPGCESIEAVDDTAYKARMVQKVGPFQIAMDIDLTIDEMHEGKQVVVSGSGKDRMGNRLKLSKLSLDIEEGSSGMGVAYTIDFTLYGKLAALGSSVIKRKAEDIRVEFTKRIIAELANS
ncbi:MAG: SRPBCC domain-containing protein [Chloroflexi bacterium]|nr:SRPBCC domain-containing protein [Chloroflexota bacterium]MDA1174295.1 SRPBCC domain-containing protein [Chloroflexota bacterium]